MTVLILKYKKGLRVTNEIVIYEIQASLLRA